MSRSILFVAALLASPVLASAQEGEPELASAAAPAATVEEESSEARVVYAERTELEFDTVDVRAEVEGPRMTWIDERSRPEFHPLIRVRTSWDDAIAASLDEVR